MVGPLLKDTPDAVVHRIQICRIGWPYLWRDKLLASLSAAWWQCMVNGMISVTSSLRHQVYCTQRSKFTGIWLVFICKLCTKNHKKSVHICKSYCEKISGTFLCGHSVHGKASVLGTKIITLYDTTWGRPAAILTLDKCLSPGRLRLTTTRRLSSYMSSRALATTTSSSLYL